MPPKLTLKISIRRQIMEVVADLSVILATFYAAYNAYYWGRWGWLLVIPLAVFGIFVIFASFPTFIGHHSKVDCPKCQGEASFYRKRREIHCSNCGDFSIDGEI